MKYSHIIFTGIIFYCSSVHPMEKQNGFTESELKQQQDRLLATLREAHKQRGQYSQTPNVEKQDSLDKEAFLARLKNAHTDWITQEALGEKHNKKPVDSDEVREIQGLEKKLNK